MTRTILIAVGLALSAIAPAANAETPCDATLVDNAHVITDAGAVTDAAKALENLGAVVRVRVIPSVAGYGNLDKYETHIQNDVCDSWQGGTGGRRSNLIVLYVSMDHQVGMYAGDSWRRELGDAWPDILANDVTPKLRDRDIGGGLASGLQSIADTIVRAKAARNAPPASANPVIIREKPTDFSGLWHVLGWIVGLGAIFLLGLFGWRAYGSRKKEQEACNAARQKALSAKGRCSGTVLELPGTFPVMGARINTLEAKFDAKTVAAWRAALAKAKSGFDSASADFSNDRGDPDGAGSVAEYEQMTQSYEALGKRFDAARSALDDLTHDMDEAERLEGSSLGELQAATDAITQAKARIDAVRGQGFKVPGPDKDIVKCESDLAAANAKAEAKDFSGSHALIEDVLDAAAKAASSAEELPATKTRLAASLTKATAELDDAEQVIATSKTVFVSMTSAYDDSCFHAVAGNGSEAEKRLAKGRTALAAATNALTAQDWQDAEESISTASTLAGEITGLMKSVTELSANLARIVSHLPDDIQQASNDIAAARSYVTTHDDDTDDRLFKDLDDADRMVAQASSLLKASKPHYLDIAEQVRNAHAVADKALSDARSEVEQAERQRQLAASSIRDAETSVSRANEYIGDHRSDVESGAETLARNASSDLADAKNRRGEGNLPQAITAAQSAKQAADRAYEKARSDVSDANEAREAARRRRQEEEDERNRSTTVIVAGGFGSSDSNSGFGGSSNWGSSDTGSSGGFGGSTSFGDSSPGVGGSTSW